MAVAIYNYHETYGTLPPHAVYSKDGKLMAYVATASNGGSLSVLSGLAISSNGDWAADVSPAGRGCDRLRLPAPEKR